MSPAHAMSSKETVTAKSLPKLASNGSNWIIYKARLEAILEAKGLSRHLTGTAKKPSILTLGAAPTAAEQTAYDEAVEKEDEFITKQGEAKTLILSTIRNGVATRQLHNLTPYEARYGTMPDLSNLKPWSNKVWMKLTDPRKLSAQSFEGRFLGSDEQSKGCRIYCPSKRSVSL